MLDQQKQNILDLIRNQAQVVSQIGSLTGIVQVAAGMSSHGDFITHSQVFILIFFKKCFENYLHTNPYVIKLESLFLIFRLIVLKE